jgi:uncharacterized protein (TIGR02598 family)
MAPANTVLSPLPTARPLLKQGRAGFSLAEATVAVGIAAMALTSLAGLLLGSLQSHRQSADRSAAAQLLTGVVADLRMAAGSSAETSPRLGLSLTGSTTLYLDAAGNAGAIAGGGNAETHTGFTANYRLECVAAPGSPDSCEPQAARPVMLRIIWPAEANPVRAEGSLTVFVALPASPP